MTVFGQQFRKRSFAFRPPNCRNTGPIQFDVPILQLGSGLAAFSPPAADRRSTPLLYFTCSSVSVRPPKFCQELKVSPATCRRFVGSRSVDNGPLHGHPGQRKTGSGFNHPRVLDGRIQHEWREHYAFMRRLVRLRIDRRPWMRSTSSVSEAMRQYWKNGIGAAMKFEVGGLVRLRSGGPTTCA
jgi:hypothetical protein